MINIDCAMPGVTHILNLSHHLSFQCLLVFHKEICMFFPYVFASPFLAIMEA